MNDSQDGDQQEKLDWADLHESQKLRQSMFRKQMRWYLCFSSILATINLTLQILGRTLHLHTDVILLACAQKGYQWVYTSLLGELFIGAHIIQIIMQAVMLEKALYKVPHEIGWFEAPKEHDGSLEEDEDEFSEK